MKSILTSGLTESTFGAWADIFEVLKGRKSGFKWKDLSFRSVCFWKTFMTGGCGLKGANSILDRVPEDEPGIYLHSHPVLSFVSIYSH